MDEGGDRTAPSAAGRIDRRELLTRATVLVSAPIASSVVAARATAAPMLRVRDRGRPFEGVTLTFGKSPHGANEKALFEKWLAPFEDATGAKVKHTIVPWDPGGVEYFTNYAGPNPFDVSYQVTTNLTGLGTRGALEDLTPYLKRADFASARKHISNSFIRPSVYDGKLYGLPFIIGTIVMIYNRRLLAEAGVSTVPRTTTELVAAARKATKAPRVWGLWSAITAGEFNWYWNLQNVHNFGGDIISNDLKHATLDSRPVLQATQYAVDMINRYKVQPPPGRYHSPDAQALFRSQRIAFLLDEPTLFAVYQREPLPFEWDFTMPVGAPNGRRTEFSTTGHWVLATRSKHKNAAWALIRFMSSARFSREYNLEYAFIPVRDDVDVSKGNPLLARNARYAACCWDGLKTHPKIAELLDAYSQGLEAAAYGKPVRAAMERAQRRATRVLSS